MSNWSEDYSRWDGRPTFEDDDEEDEYSHEWSNEALTERFKRQHTDFSTAWDASVSHVPQKRGRFEPTIDPTFVNLTNSLLSTLSHRAHVSRVPEPEAVERPPWRARWDARRGSFADPSLSTLGIGSAGEWDSIGEFGHEAERTVAAVQQPKGKAMFVPGQWDWERVFKGVVTEPSEEQIGPALRRLKSLLSHLGYEGAVPGPTPSNKENEHIKHLVMDAMRMKHGDLGQLGRDLDVLGRSELGVERGGSPDSFDSSGL